MVAIGALVPIRIRNKFWNIRTLLKISAENAERNQKPVNI